MTPLPSKAGCQRGFTLVELLMVIAIVAVLAALVLTAVSGVRGRSQQIQCLNNVRQLGLGLSGFVSQYGAYPLQVSSSVDRSLYPEHGNTWLSSISLEAGVPLGGAPGQTGIKLSTGIWDCPSASKPTSWGPKQLYIDYGYNAHGLGVGAVGLGLGGQFTGPESVQPVKESEIVAPSSTFALGDSLWGRGQLIADGGAFGRGNSTGPPSRYREHETIRTPSCGQSYRGLLRRPHRSRPVAVSFCGGIGRGIEPLEPGPPTPS